MLLRSCQSRHLASVSYLVASLPKKAQIPTAGRPKEESKTARVEAPGGNLLRFVYNPNDLNDYFRVAEYAAPTPAQITEADSFFNRAAMKHEYTCGRYDELPDIKVARKEQDLKRKLDQTEPYNWTEYHDNLSKSRTSFGVSASLLRPLPEVLLIGHTNAGKLTLINNLLLNLHQAKSANSETEYAYVSKRAGYTQCLNFYNVGNKLRLVDSPGYGKFGKLTQGDLVLEYIRKRNQLRRTFVIIDSNEGVREEDANLIGFLVENGAPFELVFTKVDELAAKKFPVFNPLPPAKDAVGRLESFDQIKEGNSRVITHFKTIIEDAGLADLATLPRLLFNNSRSTKLLKKRHGFRAIRFSILESCGLIKTPGKTVEMDLSAEANRGRRKRVTRSPRGRAEE